MSSGAYSSAEEVVQRALAALDAEEAWNPPQARKAAWLAQRPEIRSRQHPESTEP